MSDAPTRSTSHPSGRRLLGGALATGLLLLALPGARGGAVSAAAPYDWPQFNGDAAHSGNNTAESTLTASNVSGLTRLFHATLPATADGAPAYLNAVAIPGGTKDLVYVTTRDGYIVALDAHTDATVWSHQNGPGTCHINTTSSASGTPCYTTSSPAIDPNRQYVYSYGLDGYAHKYAVGDGAEIKTGGWPEVTTLKGIDEKGSSALTVAMAQSGVSYLYVTHGGYPGDNGDYQGHVTSINLADGSQKVFNANCSNLTIHFVEGGATSGSSQNDCSQRQTAIWARAGVVYDRDTDKIYMATGNGAFDAANNSPGNDWGDTVFALHPDGTGSGVNGNPLDSYTPSNYQDLQNGDTDIGSTAPAILPGPHDERGTAPRRAVGQGQQATPAQSRQPQRAGRAAPPRRRGRPDHQRAAGRRGAERAGRLGRPAGQHVDLRGQRQRHLGPEADHRRRRDAQPRHAVAAVRGRLLAARGQRRALLRREQQSAGARPDQREPALARHGHRRHPLGEPDRSQRRALHHR